MFRYLLDNKFHKRLDDTRSKVYNNRNSNLRGKTMICKKCGKQIDDLASACPYCGENTGRGVSAKASPNVIKTKTCEKCKAQVAENLAVCPYCENALISDGEDASVAWVFFGAFMSLFASLIVMLCLRKEKPKLVARLGIGMLIRAVVLVLVIAVCGILVLTSVINFTELMATLKAPLFG